MLEFLLQLIAEFLGELLLQVVVELGFGPLVHAFKPRRSANPILAAMGVLTLGGLAGLVFSMILPEPLLPRTCFSGLSLILSPLVVGAFMEWFGRWRSGRNRNRTVFATFWGGALFAFAVALVRFMAVGGESASPG